MNKPTEFSALIVDDEPRGRENLKLLLRDFCPQVNILGAVADLEQAKDHYYRLKPDVLFLDIQIGTRTVFELLRELPGIVSEIIFVTAYDEYALKAFKFMALDYLLKPIDIARLIQAVERAAGRVGSRSTGSRYEQLMLNLRTANRGQHKVAFATSEGYELVSVNDILFCKADGSYTHVHFTNGETLLVSRNLKYYEGLLAGYNFYRSHLSYLINLSHVRRVDRTQGGSIVMVNMRELPITKDKRKELEVLIKRKGRLI